jgi:hypothetical protein
LYDLAHCWRAEEKKAGSLKRRQSSDLNLARDERREPLARKWIVSESSLSAAASSVTTQICPALHAAAFLYQTPLPAWANASIAHITPSFVTFDVFEGLVYSPQECLRTFNLDTPKAPSTDLARSKRATIRQDGEHYR